MKINRCFPSCSNCLSHLLIPECSYKSYLPCWPHLSWKFFSPSMAASHVTSSTLCSRLCLTLASSRDSGPGSIPIFLALRIWSPQGSSFPRLLLVSLPLPQSSSGLPNWAPTPYSGRILLLPHTQCSLNWGLSTPELFQLEPFNLTDAF